MDFKLIVFIGTCLLIGISQGEEVVSAVNINSNVDKVTVIPPEPPKTTTTAKPDTTTTTTTAKPDTTTTTTTTTTAKPDTTTSTTTTTTAKPDTTTSTTTTPTPTPAPTPSPNTTTVAPSTTPAPPQSEIWVVRDKTSNKTCIVAQMALQFNVTYPVENKTNPNVTFANTTITVPLDNSTVAEGTCSNTTQNIILRWSNNSLEIDFGLGESKEFYVSQITLNLTTSNLPNFLGNQTVLTYKDNATLFKTPVSMSYKCDKVQDVNLWTNGTKSSAILLVSHTQLQAFREKDDKIFSEAHDCDTFDTPDIVPIAVGCALALLVLIVLAAYLIGRRRSQNRGYLSIDSQ